MYKIQLLICTLLLSVASIAQTQRVTTSGTVGVVDIDRGGYGALQFERIPADYINFAGTDSLGRIWVKNGNFYYHDGTLRVQALTAKDSNQIKIWGAAGAGLVGSVFGRTGAVIAQSGDYTIAQITNGVSTLGSYTNPSWLVSIPYTKITGAPWLTTIPASGVTAGTYSYASVTVGLDGRITAASSGAIPTAYTASGYVRLSGTSFYLDTAAYKAATKTDLNAYYLASNPSSYVGLTALSGTAPVSYDNGAGVISMHVADATHDGYTTAVDWGAFNGKQAALSGTGFVKVSGTTISYDNSTYLTSVPTTTVNSLVISFGGNNTITAAAGTLTGSALSASVTTSSLVTVAAITTGTWTATPIADGYVASSGNWNTAYTNRIASFTTSGSGAATFTPGGALNIPTPTLAALGGTTDHSALTNLVWTASGHLGAGAGLAGFNSSSVAIVYTISGGGTAIPTTSVTALSSLTTVGTIVSGAWTASSISTTYTDAKIKTVTGTSNRLTIGGTSTDPTFDVSTSYAGQATIVTVGTVISGTWNASVLTEAYGGTNQSTYALGDLLYSSATNTLSKLAGNTTSAKKFLSQTGTGTVSAAPAWGVLVAGDVPDISATYSVKAGNTSLITVGTVTTGTWNASVIAANYGGTGIANNSAATVTSSGNFAYTRTLSATTNATFPSGAITVGALGVQQTWTKGNAGAVSTLTDASTIAVDLSLGNNLGTVTLGGNRTLGVPTNIVPGQSGTMQFDQDITGTRILTTAWIYGGSGGTAIVLSTGKLAHDVVSYFVDYYLSATATMTIATPCVVTQTAHGMPIGSCRKVQFTTTGGFPTNVSASTTYYATIVDANTYKLSTSFANAQAGTFIATSGSQSGTHTGVIGNITLTLLTDSR